MGIPFFNGRCVILIFFSWETIKKKKNIYLRGLIFPPFFFCFLDVNNFSFFLCCKTKFKEPNRPNPLSLYIVTMSAVLMTSNCFVRGFVECFINTVPLVSDVRPSGMCYLLKMMISTPLSVLILTNNVQLITKCSLFL